MATAARRSPWRTVTTLNDLERLVWMPQHMPELGQLDIDAHQAPVGSKQAVASILSRSGSLRVVTVRHGDRRAAAVAIGARSV